MKRGLFSFKLYIMFASLLIIVILIFSFILYTNAKQQAVLSTASALEANTQQMSYLLDNVFNQMNILSLQLTATSDLQEYFQRNLATSIANPEFEKVLNKVASQFVLSFANSSRITIYCPDGSYSSIGIPSQTRIAYNFFHSDSFPEWYSQRNDFSGYTALLPPERDLWSNKDATYISFLRRLNNSFSFEQVGVIEVQVAVSTLQSIADSIRFSDSRYYLVGADGSIFLSSDSAANCNADIYLREYLQRQTASFSLCDQELVSAIDLTYSDLILIQVQPVSRAIDIVGSFGVQMIAICITLIVFFLILGFFLIGTLTRPLKDLQRAISEISPVHDSLLSRDELSFMKLSFLSLKEQLNTAISEAVDAKTRQEHAQFVALQAQINPHFTFNAISVIAATAITNGDIQVYEIVSAFSDMLRYILSASSETVSFSTELQHCEAYLKIMKYRYEDQLDVDITYPDTIKDMPLPKLSLQPLLENSFKHGFDKALPPFSISLSVTAHAKHIQIQVRDNGSGMSNSKLEQLKTLVFQTEAPITRTDDLGLGLRSTYLRMRQLYPDTSMELQTTSNGEFFVSICFTLQDDQLLS